MTGPTRRRFLRWSGVAAGAHFRGYPTEPGEAVPHVRLDDRREERVRFDFAQRDAACLGLEIRVETAVSESESPLSVWKTTNPAECADDPATDRST